MLGFLGLTADVTGFELDRGVLFTSLFFAVCVQFLKDSVPADDEKAKEWSRQRQFSK